MGGLIEQFDAAVSLGEPDRVTLRIKEALQSMCRATMLELPEAMKQPGESSYARRLLHRSPELDYTVVLMAWGPGQGTPLHDHGGLWCVECVIEGEVLVTQYDLIESRDELCKFTAQDRIRAGIGEAGCLIPPYEYHVLGNALQDRTSLHVYGGEMESCNLFLPDGEGWWKRSSRQLTYDH